MVHKKYIEVEALLDRVSAMRNNLQLEINNPFEDGIRMGIEEMWKFIENIPCADVKPVVHGKWIADGDGYHWTHNCSICGWKDGYPFNERHKYCPNCGARMEAI